MARIHKLYDQLGILKKYILKESLYNVTSYEGETTIVVMVESKVLTSDHKELLKLGAHYDEDNNLWYVG